MWTQRRLTESELATSVSLGTGTIMTRILFVDYDERALEGLRRMLQPLNGDWECGFANSGSQALNLLSLSPYDVLVTEVRLLDMTGIELLERVRTLYPLTARFVQTSVANYEPALKTTGTAHQFLAKTGELSVLRSAIERALKDRDDLPETGLRRIVSSLGSLPSLPSVYFDLIRAMDSPEVSVSEVGRIMSRDMAMAAKVVQLVNSAFFGVRKPILDTAAAVVYLGCDTVRALALQVAVFSQFRKSRIPEFSIEGLQQHSVRVAGAAKLIASNAGLSRNAANDCAAGGFLHDIGKLVLAASVPDRYQRALRQAARHALPTELAELQEFGAGHSEVGAYLLGLWGMPEVLTDIVRLHHSPPDNSQRTLTKAAVVYIANIADHNEMRHEVDPRCLEFARAAGHQWEELTCVA
jgi:putative nucleotidyltransferase with HDIG domain